MISQDNFKDRLERLGWRSMDKRLWDNLDEFRHGIVILAPPLDTVPSPSGNAIYTIVQDLAERSPVPCLILSIWPEQGEPQKCDISDHILYLQKPFKPVPFEKYIPYRVKKNLWGTGWPRQLNYAQTAAQLCDFLHVDKIVVEDVPIFGMIVKKKLGTKAKIFLHQHADAPLSYPKFWWKRINKSFSGIIFVSRKTMANTENRHGKLPNARVIYNGVDLTYFDSAKWKEKARNLRNQYSIAENELVVIYVGRVIPGKGCLELARAFLQANVPEARLVIIGSLTTGLFSSKEFQINMNHAIDCSSGRIISTGTVHQKEIPAWYEASDLVVVPSIQSEGLPKVVTEALAMGKPVLASNRGGSFELIRPGENGWILEDPKNIEIFSNQLRNILQKPIILAEMSCRTITLDRLKMDINRTSRAFFNFILNI